LKAKNLIKYKQAMNVVGKTITGAASGEIAGLRRRRVHNLRQKDRRVKILFGVHGGVGNFLVIN
jgi:hypothetical protein